MHPPDHVPFAYTQTRAVVYFFNAAGQVCRQLGDGEHCIVAPNFLVLLDQMATRLESGVYQLDQVGQINRFGACGRMCLPLGSLLSSHN
jgi:hypothetical protein